jgi:hypothetical protein
LHVTRHTSHVTRHTSHVTRHRLPDFFLFSTPVDVPPLPLRPFFQPLTAAWLVMVIRPLLSHANRYTSHVTRHTSHVTHHTSHVTLHRFRPCCLGHRRNPLQNFLLRPAAVGRRQQRCTRNVRSMRAQPPGIMPAPPSPLSLSDARRKLFEETGSR